MKQTKTHETPQFEVIKQNEANSKFFVASGSFSAPAPTATTYTEGSTSEW